MCPLTLSWYPLQHQPLLDGRVNGLLQAQGFEDGDGGIGGRNSHILPKGLFTWVQESPKLISLVADRSLGHQHLFDT